MKLAKAKKAAMGALVVLVAAALATPVEAEMSTGQYTGNGTTSQFFSGLVTIRSLTIVEVAARGPSNMAYTTNTIQATNGNGAFLNGDRKDAGVALEAGSVTVTHPDFNEDGVVYHWEAHGD